MWTIVMGAGLLASTVATATILPPNDLDKEDNVFEFNPNVTEADFNAVIQRGMDIYGPIVEAFGGRLEIVGRWTDSTVNASANRDVFDPNKWIVTMYGGLARRPEVTVDGFVMVLCHELGHHLGGFPFVRDWAADEGQADYFASLECTKHFWGADRDGNAAAREQTPQVAKDRCDDIWSTQSGQDLCYRSMMASKSISDLLGALGETEVHFDTPDTSEVEATNHRHPDAQCRLDTYMAGALCTADFSQTIIPGVNKDDHNGLDAETESAEYTCTAQQFEKGLRPHCWFKPRI
jgi:hypothetical protein